MLSYEGKSILIESSLSSLPNYTIGVYLLPKEVHHKMEWIRLEQTFIGILGIRRSIS
jgi:hypothetical protein